jgi:hypothetical protein
MAFDPKHNSTFKGGSCFVAYTLPDVLDIVLHFPAVPFWARGESKEYDFPCQPAIARKNHSFDNHNRLPSEGSLTKGELDAIICCQKDYLSGDLTDELFSRFFDREESKINVKENELLYWASLAQHHNKNQKYPTRLLDVTSDILVATYFACVSHQNEDGYVFYGNFSHNDLLKFGKATVQGSFFDILRIEDISNPLHYCSPSEDSLYLAPLPFPNRPMTAQRGAFVWSRNPAGGYFNMMRQLIIKIPGSCKEKFLQGLDWLGYNEQNLFPPELPHLSSIIRVRS